MSQTWQIGGEWERKGGWTANPAKGAVAGSFDLGNTYPSFFPLITKALKEAPAGEESQRA
jgi:hypothetical protein